jgi:tRNA pseudouridine55 synthase
VISGVLLIDKPVGITSTDVVRAARKALGTRKIGHCGTLDPPASGLLVVCVGSATKAVPFLMSGIKFYEAQGKLGFETTTDDATGELLREAPWTHVRKEHAEAFLQSQLGNVKQMAPRVSALKIDGRRLYERVRAGESVDAILPIRTVQALELTLDDWNAPAFKLSLTVGKGYYVRSLVRDLGRHTDSAAHLTSLRRTRIGSLYVNDAISVDEIAPDALITVPCALRHLRQMRADPVATRRLRNGQQVAIGDGVEFLPGSANPVAQADKPIVVLDTDGELVAITEHLPNEQLKVIRAFGVEQATASHV